MPETLSNSLVTAKDTLRAVYPWAFLLTVQIDDTTAFRVCTLDSAIVFGGETYLPFPVKVRPQKRDASGALNAAEVTVSNIGRQIIRQIRLGNVLDRELRLRLVNLSDLTTCVDFGTYRISRVTITGAVLRCELRLWDLRLSRVPARVFHRGRCQWVYGSPQCGYDTTRAGAIATCTLSVDDCRAHGDDEVAAGMPRLHPLRFGGQPGIPKGPARV